mgnify:CR=1 FL=1
MTAPTSMFSAALLVPAMRDAVNRLAIDPIENLPSPSRPSSDCAGTLTALLITNAGFLPPVAASTICFM